MTQLSIQEYFARMCAAGLMPECKEITAIYLKISDDYFWIIAGGNYWQDMKTYYSISSDLIDKDNNKKITLRKDGVNVYELEWRKPTDGDLGKMCWFWSYDFITCLSKLHTILSHHACSQNTYLGDSVHTCYCLLADHGAISPTEQDFNKVYGGMR